MKKFIYLLALVTLTAGWYACNQPRNSGSSAGMVNTEDTTGMDSMAASADKIAIEPVADSKAFPDATLTVTSMQSKKISDDSASITVNYGVKNFKLTQQTEHDHNAANSKQGQHIHFILDNKPYAALYKPTHSDTVALNSEHYLLSFLSRSYHESIKDKPAAVLKHFKIDANGTVEEMEIPKAPMLFYSRPKGSYTGKDTEDILLDFYIWNTTLSANGNKVRVTANDDTFTVDSWQPYFIKNAPKGDLKIKLELLDQAGNALSGENTSVERTATLK